MGIIIIPAGLQRFPVTGSMFLVSPQKRLIIVPDTQKILSVSLHFGKPFMGDDRLVFQIGKQGIHIILKGSKAGFLQVLFGDIQIAAGHEYKNQNGDSCT